MGRLTKIRMWVASLVTAARRDERGAITDETAMIGILLLAAVGVAGIILGLVMTGAASLDLGF